MEYKEISKKLVVVMNKRVEVGRVMNAIAHMAIGLGASITNKEELRLQDYKDKDDSTHPSISDIPFIVLRANSNQIRDLRNKAIEKGYEFTDFTNTMVGTSYVEQHERTKNTQEKDLEYFGICIFANWDEISNDTKKFSLWK